MNKYSIALFLHVVGALVLFAMLILEWIGLRQVRSTNLSEQVRAWLGFLRGAGKAGFLSMLLTVVTGVYMMVVWGRTPWLVTTIGALILMIVLARVATPRLKAFGQSLGTVDDPFLWVSVQTRVAIVFGIIFLKIAKPDWVGSLLTIGTTVVLGVVSALLMPRREAQPRVISTD